ncbi:MAG: cytosolic protein [Thaumarchaeota archaeon]|nr:cytosolic protein [Nitrososphaerota archaeon]
MNRINLDDVRKYVEKNIYPEFHERRLESLKKTDLKGLIRKKNPYLFRAKRIETAQELIESLLNAKLSSSEEGIIGHFLEGLAIFVARKTLNAHKSASHGIDFEYDQDGTHYMFSVKSGENWGNSSQWNALENDVKTALRVLDQSQHGKDAKCYLGICYGKTKPTLKRGIIHQVSGQAFWYMISGQKNFYKDIVKPIGYQAREHNEAFNENKAKLINKLTGQFIGVFCDKVGNILWNEVVKFNSGNLEGDNAT